MYNMHPRTRPHPHLHSSFFFFFLNHPVSRLLEATICSLFLPFFPFLSFLWLIKSPALWYTAKPPGHFYGLLGPPVSSLLPLLHPYFPRKMNDTTPLTFTQPRKRNFSLSLTNIFFSNWEISSPAILFGLLWEATWLNGFPFEGNENADHRYQSSYQHVVFQFHALTFQASSFLCPFTKTYYCHVWKWASWHSLHFQFIIFILCVSVFFS